MLKAWYQKLVALSDMFFSAPVSAFAAQTAFFLLISAFPFIMMLITIMGYIPALNPEMLQEEVNRLLPDMFSEFINAIITEVYESRSTALISIAAISTLLAASKGFISLIRGMNLSYGTKEKRNYFKIRGMAVLCTITMLIAILLTLLVLVFGDKLLSLLTIYVPAFGDSAFASMSLRIIVIFALLTVLFVLIYLAAPCRKSNVFAELPGALLSAASWIVFSVLYAIYLKFMNSYVYGSLTSAVFIMLWLYACIYILFVGGEVNCFLQRKKQMMQEDNNHVS